MHRILLPEHGRQLEPRLCALAVMTKVPQPGKVKTRLSPPLTPLEAAELNICFLRDTTTAIRNAVNATAAAGVGVYTPLGGESAYAGILPNDFYLIAQRGDNFGERLTCAASDLFAVGFESVCLIDSDSPTVPERVYVQATQGLAVSGDRIVFGPCDDGGYYLIGMKQLHRELFQDIAWSTERVAEQTLSRAAELRLEVLILPTWYDVDDRHTLGRLCDELLGRNGNSGGYEAEHTRNYLAHIVQMEGRERIWPNK